MDKKNNGVSAIVEHEYTAREPDELNLVKGAIIHNVKVQPGGWWEGTLVSGKSGMFPENFVRVLEPDDKNPVVLRDKSARRCKAVYSYTQCNNDELSLGVGDIIEFIEEAEEGWWRGKLGPKVGVFPSNFVVNIENVSPMLANRRSTSAGGGGGGGGGGVGGSALKLKNNLNSSREDLLSASSLSSSAATLVTNWALTQVEKDAPSLPPKPIRETCEVIFPYAPSNEDELELKEGDIITIITKELPDKGWWKGELRGKLGVFPDNFVTLLPPESSPIKDPIKSQTINKPDRPPPATVSSPKPLLNNNTNIKSNRKDSFGSKDSLNDTNSISSNSGGSSSGGGGAGVHVAGYRKSLENTINIEKKTRKNIDMKSTTDIRKSLENLDDRKSVTSGSTPAPPVLTKKPNVPMKKSPTVGSVAGNLFSGLKQKVKSDNQQQQHQRMTSSQDNLDGIGGSKVNINNNNNNSQIIADNNVKGIQGERLIKRIPSAHDSNDFDNVERGGSILQDVRAGRAKAPKRRPPTTVTSSNNNLIGNDDNNNNSNYINGTTTYLNGGNSHDSIKSTDYDESDDLAKPKPREWEKQKAPWMAELKANQARKISPNFESKSPDTSTIMTLAATAMATSSSTTTTTTTVIASTKSTFNSLHEHDNIKSFSNSSNISNIINNSLSNNVIISSSSSTSTTSTMSSSSSSSVSATAMLSHNKKITEQQNYEIRSHSVDFKNSASTTSIENNMAKSLTSLSTKISASDKNDETISNSSISSNSSTSASKIRATSDNLRNRSISPIGRITKTSSVSSTNIPPTSSTSSILDASSISNKHILANNMPETIIPPVTAANVCSRVTELEQKVLKLEKIVLVQNVTIEELLKSLKEESERVKLLRGELDKYAQCVTQV